MASSLLGIGVSGLQVFQNSLNTIGNNITNVNTEGYSKQRVELSTREPQISGSGFIGSGVKAVSITRSFNAFIESNLRSSTSSAAEFDAFRALATQLDNVVADSDTGVANSIQRFFNAMQDVSDSPTSTAARDVLLNEAENLSGQFNQLASWFQSVRNQVNGEIKSNVTEINRLSTAIADLNEKIVLQEGRSGGQPANSLLDQRDVLIRDLSEVVSVTTLRQDDGSLNVLAGSGQVLVVGSRATTLETFIVAGDPNQLGIAIRGNGGTLVPITEQISGGKLGGTVNFRDRMLDPASNSLGLTAIGLSQYINEQQNAGMDLDGLLGNDFFEYGQPQVQTIAGASGNVLATFDDVSQLNNSDYRLQFSGGAWQLTRSGTNQAIAMTGTGTAGDPFIAEGVSLEITAVPANGDSYIIRPTRNGAVDMGMVLANSRQIAAAAPIRSLSADANTGTGTISAGVVTDINNVAFQSTPGQLSPPVLIRFTATNSYDIYDNTNPVAPVILEAGIAYNSATGGDVFPTPGGINNGYDLRITGAPVIGDEFSSEYNTGGVGDNRNSLLMAGLANSKILANGTASINDSYSSLVSDVGTSTKQAELSSLSSSRVLEQATSARESVSGVNLDEEAANLIRYQQAYQAAAQLISVANELFDVVLNSVRR
ncbi:Flagellar hook-associated protein FlgK [hydrothermal vent metagenome]|uniref:Flagellar hook-associated protein FlgK n=1 Tax=hydrothermal vent metagenome TaxID=652676 RepID=A0A3B0XDT8_9ZZZZ